MIYIIIIVTGYNYTLVEKNYSNLIIYYNKMGGTTSSPTPKPKPTPISGYTTLNTEKITTQQIDLDKIILTLAFDNVGRTEYKITYSNYVSKSNSFYIKCLSYDKIKVSPINIRTYDSTNLNILVSETKFDNNNDPYQSLSVKDDSNNYKYNIIKEFSPKASPHRILYKSNNKIYTVESFPVNTPYVIESEIFIISFLDTNNKEHKYKLTINEQPKSETGYKFKYTLEKLN